MFQRRKWIFMEMYAAGHLLLIGFIYAISYFMFANKIAEL